MMDKELLGKYLDDQRKIDVANKYIDDIKSKIALVFMIISIVFLFSACEVIKEFMWQDRKDLVVSGSFAIIFGLLLTGTLGAWVIEKLPYLDKLYRNKLGELITETDVTRGHNYNTRKYDNYVLTCNWKLKHKDGTRGINVDNLEEVSTDDRYFLKIDKKSYEISEDTYNTLYNIENNDQIIILDANKYKGLG